MKKAQGLPFNVIIIAALAIVVLIIVIVLFNSKTDDIAKDLDTCFSKGGKCISGVDGCDREIPNTKCPNTGERCCVSLSG
tara:strand:+ start:154 stop:393 length:240 start_codon:yes stop_codon:yes gene_type:complete